MPATPRLTAVKTADILAKVSGAAISPEQIEADIAAGAPLSPDGTLNLLLYAAWLLKNER